MTAACKRFMTTPYIELDLDGKIADMRSKTPLLFVSDSIGLLKATASQKNTTCAGQLRSCTYNYMDKIDMKVLSNARTEGDRKRDRRSG